MSIMFDCKSRGLVDISDQEQFLVDNVKLVHFRQRLNAYSLFLVNLSGIEAD